MRAGFAAQRDSGRQNDRYQQDDGQADESTQWLVRRCQPGSQSVCFAPDLGQLLSELGEPRARKTLFDAALESARSLQDLLGVELSEHGEKAYSKGRADSVGLWRLGPRGGTEPDLLTRFECSALCHWRGPSTRLILSARAWLTWLPWFDDWEPQK